jgi:hypothetical protein
MKRVLTIAASALAMAFALVSCDKPKVVEALKKPSEIKSSAKQARKPAPKHKSSSSRARTPVVQFTPAATPKPGQTPQVLMATQMSADTGKADGQGGWNLISNGALQKGAYKIEFPVHEIQLEMKGDPAQNIWPEVELNLHNQTTGKNYFPWSGAESTHDYITTSTYFLYIKPVEPPIPPGEYLITFRYFNNNKSVPGGEDRNAYLRKIVFVP